MIEAAVLGSPIWHSLSPLLHTSAYKELGVLGHYQAIEVGAGGLESFMGRVDHRWTGFSLTMPLKEEAVKFADHVEPLAARINSANTLVRDAGTWRALTTDVLGFTEALKMHGVQVSGSVVILGAGATARAAAAACDGLAADITVVNRSLNRIEAMSESVEHSELNFVDWSQMHVLEDADLVISTTPAGVSDAIALPSKTSAPFFEALYKPWPTVASSEWSLRGGLVIDGLDLLIHQAMAQIEIFSARTFDKESMYSLLRAVGVDALK